jgi:acyl transferase domain-containing protein
MSDTDIAIIGMACRFPGAETVDQFWRNLSNGLESLSDFSNYKPQKDAGLDRSSLPFIKVNNLISDFDCFDADFFGVSSREAALMDPQHRLFLECAWTALEHAGYNPEQQPGLTGLYAGVYANYYLLRNIYPSQKAIDPASEIAITLGNEKDHLTTYTAYKLNLKGPVATIQATCASGLASVHLACESLLTYSSDMMLAGGVTISVPQNGGYLYQEGGLLSSDGHVRSFDATASGTVYSNGVGIVVLKRLSSAIQDGDTVFAVIKGSAMNNDGAAKIGYTAPSANSQVEVIKRALSNAEANPNSISYVEGHGTGTPMGDSIEIEALESAYKGMEVGQCALGSVKSNIGHLGPASGISGLIKVALSLHHRKLVPSINFTKMEGKLEEQQNPFYINTNFRNWEFPGKLKAGVSAFGLGGTNVHVILEESPKALPSSAPPPSKFIFSLSAANLDSLSRMIIRMRDFLVQNSEINPLDLAFTLHVGRKAFPVRFAIVFKSIGELIESINKAITCFPHCLKDTSKIENRSETNLNSVKHLKSAYELSNEDALQDLANLWQQGESIRWEEFYKSTNALRIPLPAYAFLKKRHWIEEPRNNSSDFDSVACENSEDIVKDVTLLWKQHLGIEEVNLEDNFFESGGTSLSATSLVTGIQMKFGIEMELKDFFEKPTVEGIVNHVLDKLLLNLDEKELDAYLGANNE